MSTNLHNIRRPYGPSLLFKCARCSLGNMGSLAELLAEKKFADSWRNDSRDPLAVRPKRGHKGAMGAKVGAALDTATTPATRKRLGKQEVAVMRRAPSASWGTPAYDFFRLRTAGSASGALALKSARRTFLGGCSRTSRQERRRDRTRYNPPAVDELLYRRLSTLPWTQSPAWGG
jgi:hypothetical protein